MDEELSFWLHSRRIYRRQIRRMSLFLLAFRVRGDSGIPPELE